MAKAKKRRRHKRKKAFGFAANPKRRKRYRRKVHALRRHTTYRTNPRHRRRRRSSYRSNPPSVRSIAGEIGWGAAGYMTTKVVGNFVTPMVGGVVGTSDIARIGVKIGVAYLSAWALSLAFGQRVFMTAMIGGSLEAIQDATKTFIAPTFPMLADYGGMGVYYEPTRRIAAPRGLHLYPELGDGLSPDHDAVV